MKQRSALSKVFSRCCFFPSPCLLLHRSTFPSSPSLFICRVLCCLSPAVDSLSLYVVRLFYFAASSCGSLAVHASQPMPPCGMDAGKVGGAAIGRVSLLSDTDTREWSKSQNNGVADCSQTSVCIKPPSHIVTDHLSSRESQQGRSQSKYMMNRQPHQCDWYSLFCLNAVFNT